LEIQGKKTILVPEASTESTMSTENSSIHLLLCLCCALLAACSDGSDRQPGSGAVFAPIPQPLLQLPPDAGNIALSSTEFDLAAVGYRQDEFFFSGSARAFANTTELGSDGLWDIEVAGQAPYLSRMVVYRPIDPQQFSGTVIVEWLNVSAGFSSGPVWRNTHTELIRQGHAWVAIDAQQTGIEGGGVSVSPVPLYLKAINPDRYSELQHPGDSYSYDIFTQAAQALRSPGAIDPLAGLVPDVMIAAGQSQSAYRLTTLVNTLQPIYGPFDGYFLFSRLVMNFERLENGQWVITSPSGAAPLRQSDVPDNMPPLRVEIRPDLRIPVLMLQSETDVIDLQSIELRQADTERFRLWEVAGSAHADYYGSIAAGTDTGESPEAALIVEESTIGGFINCLQPINAGPMAWVANAAVNGLDQWTRDNRPPPSAELLNTLDDQSGFQLDTVGNALGGIRTPHVDAPAARLTGSGQPPAEIFCSLYGTTTLFDAATMATLHVDRDGYVRAVSDAAESAVQAGFLLPADAERIIAAAGLQWDLAP
jgi:hypothetical protein